MAVVHQGVHAHQPAHGTAGDEGVGPVGQGAVLPVDGGLEGVYEPVHGDLPPALYMAEVGLVEGVGGVLRQPPVVRMVVALHRRHNEGHLKLVQILPQSPALAIGGVGVEKNVVAVKHVQHGVVPAGLPVVAVRQIEVGSPGLVSGQLGDGHIPGLDHNRFLPTYSSSVYHDEVKISILFHDFSLFPDWSRFLKQNLSHITARPRYPGCAGRPPP